MATAQAVAPALVSPEAAAEQLQPEFRRFARILRPRDRSLQDDVTQEMSLAVLKHRRNRPVSERPATLKYFLALACWRGKDYLDKERLREHPPLPPDPDDEDAILRHLKEAGLE